MKTYRGTMTTSIVVDADNKDDAMSQMADVYWDMAHEWTPETIVIVGEQDD